MNETLAELIAEAGIPRVSVVIEAFDGSIRFAYRERETYHAASTMKVPVMVEVFRQVSEGRLELEHEVLVENRFSTITDGSEFNLQAGDDSEKSLYSRLGQPATVRELVDLMITMSSNLATNILVDLVTAVSVQETLSGLGVEGMKVLRGVEDQRAFESGRNNTVTAEGYSRLLTLIGTGGLNFSSEMIEILKRQTHVAGLPSALPPGMWLANKPGWTGSVCHDGGVLGDRNGPRASVVVLTQGARSQADAQSLMGRIGGAAAMLPSHAGSEPF